MGEVEEESKRQRDKARGRAGESRRVTESERERRGGSGARLAHEQ